MSGLVNSLFGNWTDLAKKAPPKVEAIDSLFSESKQRKQEIVFAVDGSGSTLYEENRSYDGKTFQMIYAEAIKNLYNLLPKNNSNTIVCWSSIAKQLGDANNELIMFNNAIQNDIPIAKVISGMNGGTSPRTILGYTDEKICVLVTDGDIGPQEIQALKMQIPQTKLGPVFLVIVPHIATYRDLYNSETPRTEVDPKNNILLTIPNAFSERLATVLVWNYRKKSYEMIQELSAPWIDTSKNLTELLSSSLPVMNKGEFFTKVNERYLTFSLKDLIVFLKDNCSVTTINSLINMNVKMAIRQQGTVEQKNEWNLCVTNMYNSLIAQRIAQEFTETAIPPDTTMIERLKIISTNDAKKKQISNQVKSELVKLFEQLLIDKVVSEMTNIAASKAVQTNANVNAFKTMAQQDKLTEIAPVLVQDECSICGTNTNIYKTISIPVKLILELKLCSTERTVPGKKNKTKVIKSFDLNAMKRALANHTPHLNCLNLCPSCANSAMTEAKGQGDPEYGVSLLVPQNMNNYNFVNRLLIVPFIRQEKINLGMDPNESRLSFSRQWFRGFISSTIGLDPASVETMNACLCFLSSLANNKENALLVYPNQMSLLRGGRLDKFPETVGRLFTPSVQKISAEILTTIVMVSDTVYMAEMDVLPESNKLLLLCLIERNVSTLLNAKQQREKTVAKLNTVLDEIRTNGNSSDKVNFEISDNIVELIKNSSSNLDFIEHNESQFQTLIATYLQNHMHLDIALLARRENSLGMVLSATNIANVAKGLNLSEDYLQKMITRSGMTNESFMQILAPLVTDLATSQDKQVLMKYI